MSHSRVLPGSELRTGGGNVVFDVRGTKGKGCC